MIVNTPVVSRMIILFFTVLYVLLPTINNTSDALGYASFPEISSHHLLYDWLCKCILNATHSSKNTLHALQIFNALFAGCILSISNKILNAIGATKPWIWLIFLGSTFGIMRFATENETYIIPIFLSLCGSYFLLLAEKKNTMLWPAFAFLALAVLFHQIHLMWFVAACIALLRSKFFGIKQLLIPLTMLFVVAGIYTTQAKALNIGFLQFIQGQLGGETVQLLPNFNNIKFTAINFIRSFVQIHGNVLLLFQKVFWIRFTCIAAIGIAIIAFFILNKKKNTVRSISDIGNISLFKTTVVWALILQFAFAFYSVGNAEFMVMLPLLMVLFFVVQWKVNMHIILIVGYIIFTWNTLTAILPGHIYNYQNPKMNVNKWINRNGYFIANDKILFQNMYGFMAKDHKNKLAIISNLNFDTAVAKSPADLDAEGLRNLHAIINTKLNTGQAVYTDCINYPQPISRKSILNGQVNSNFFAMYTNVKYDSFPCFYGTVYIYKLYKK